MGIFERYLSVWVALSIGLGILLGELFPGAFEYISGLSISTVNLPIAALIWLMIYPMMVQVDFSSLGNLSENGKGLAVTTIANWVVKPFSMAFFAWLFFQGIFQQTGLLGAEKAEQYTAGAILLGAAPCTAMVFVWSYLAKGSPQYTLVQVSFNDLILLVAFVPLVELLLGITNIEIPLRPLITSVVMFVLIPLLAGYLTHRLAVRYKSKEWLMDSFLGKLAPVSKGALLVTLILLFAYQGQTILREPIHILLIAIPLTIQTYFIYFATWFSGKFLGLSYQLCAPSAMIGASNFFELAVAVAIMLFGLDSGASLATVVGVLIEVPVMLSLVAISKRWSY